MYFANYTSCFANWAYKYGESTKTYSEKDFLGRKLETSLLVSGSSENNKVSNSLTVALSNESESLKRAILCERANSQPGQTATNKNKMSKLRTIQLWL